MYIAEAIYADSIACWLSLLILLQRTTAVNPQAKNIEAPLILTIPGVIFVTMSYNFMLSEYHND